MNFICQKFLLLLSVAVTMAIPFDPEMSAISFRKNMAPSVGIHDPLEEHDSIALRQYLPNQIISFIANLLNLKVLNLLIKFNVVSNCIANPQSCPQNFLLYKALIYLFLNCVIGVPILLLYPFGGEISLDVAMASLVCKSSVGELISVAYPSV